MKTAFPNSVLVSTPAKIGFAGNSNPWDGQITEFLIFNRALSSDERATIENYCNQRYSLW